MKTEPKITTITRTVIADALNVQKLWYHGRLKEADFLNRLYDLKSMRSTDYRSEYNNAYKDIYQHADMNYGDWEPDWVFTDERFNLMHCQDTVYLRFLAETLNPNVRMNDEETNKMVKVYNRYLEPDGYHFYKADELSGRPIYNYDTLHTGQAQLAAKAVAIKEYLDTIYLNRKITQMNQAVLTDTDVAIGTGKELLETICKAILKDKNTPADKNWTLQQLLKHTTSALDFLPGAAEDPEAAERSIKQILGGIASIVQGVSELRNAYGSGHGKDADFKGLESKYAKLFAGVVAEIAILYLATHDQSKLTATPEDEDLPF